MLDIGWSELILIGIVALIVVGPKDLPRMFHTLGRFTGKLRAMGREFQMAMNDAAKSSGLDEVRKDMNDIVSKKNLGLDALETAARRFETWDPTRPSAPATASAAVAAASAAAAAEATAEEIAADEALGLHEVEKPQIPASGAAPAKSDT
jgi:sec-independent protein translocase protein TatB